MHNDVKLDNIMIENLENIDYEEKYNALKGMKIHLIDFGFSQSFRCQTSKKHLKHQKIKSFKGNYVYASHNHLTFHSTSRRDDLVSLVYVLINLLNGDEFLGFKFY